MARSSLTLEKLGKANSRSPSYPFPFAAQSGSCTLFGNRIQKDVDPDGAGASAATVLKMAYDRSGNAWADLDNSGSLTIRRIFGIGVDAIQARIYVGYQEEWYLTDRLGSVRDLVSGSNGTIIDHIDYNAFGKVTNETTPANGDRYSFTGRERDIELGLQYHRARYLDPNTMRWLSMDPIGFTAGDPNLYRYVGNNTPNATDPSGEIFFLPFLIVGAVLLLGGTAAYEYSASEYNAAFDLQQGRTAEQWTPAMQAEYDNRIGRARWSSATGDVLAATGVAVAAAPFAGAGLGFVAGSSAVGAAGVTLLGGAGVVGLGFGVADVVSNWDPNRPDLNFRNIGVLAGPTLAGFSAARAFRGGMAAGRTWRAARATQAANRAASARLGSLSDNGYGQPYGTPAPIQNAGRLTFDPVTQSWRSTAGLVYGQGSPQGNRVLHVLEHLTPNPSKPLHSVFNVNRNQLIGLLDEAWVAHGAHTIHPKSGNWNYRVPMGRVIGTNGENAMNISVRPGTSEIMTAFPVQ